MPRLTFVAQSARDTSNLEATTERLLNCYAEAAAGDSRTRMVIRQVPGLLAHEDFEVGTPTAAIGRAARVYAILDGGLYWLPIAGGSVTSVGAVTSATDVSMAVSGTIITIAGGNNYYTATSGGTLTNVGGGLLTAEHSVTYVKGYTVITENGGARFEWTALGDPTTRSALNFATAESVGDDVVRAVASKNYLYLFGEKSTEVWYPTGDAGPDAFALLAGGVIETGLLSYHLVIAAKETVFFVGDDSIVYTITESRLQPVSTPAVHTALIDGTPARCGYYEARGHKFCVIYFSDRPAWVYDMTTQLWHERGTGDAAWAQEFIVRVGTEWGVIDDDGELFLFDLTTYQDGGATLTRQMTSRPLYMDGERFSVSELEFMARMGAGFTVALSISGNGGNTWTDLGTRSLGSVGAYGQRAVWNALGSYRQFAARFTITANGDIPVYSDCNVVVT